MLIVARCEGGDCHQPDEDMIPVFKNLKERIERISGWRMYRNTLPHGVDLGRDLERKFGRSGFKVVFDVGANDGHTACHYFQEFPQAEIYSFEPVSATYQKLVAATQALPRVHPYQLGMGREAGQATINVNPLSTTSSIVLRRPEDHPETIEVETVAGFAEKHRLESIDFLKIDTEGYDLEVLIGATPLLQRQKIRFIQVECEPVERTERFVNFSALADFFWPFGYRLFGVYEQQPEWDGRNRLMYWNAVFICEKLIDAKAKL